MTAIEWLIKEIKNEDHHTEGELGNSCIDVNTLLMLCEQAKQLEKQQIIDAYIDRMDCTSKEEMRNILGNQYYNETYGSKGSDEDLIDAINMARNEPDMSGDDIIFSLKQSKNK